MAYAFEQQSGVAGQVRAIAIEQIDRAIDGIEAKGDFDQTVHALRRSTKKLRALLKLVQPVFPDYEGESSAIKTIAGHFAVARDAAVMVETLSQIVDSPDEGQTNWGIGAVAMLDRLRERAWHLRHQTGEADLLGLARADLALARERVANWSFEASGKAIVIPGLRRSYRRFRTRLEEARRDTGGEVVHDWRKAAKAWWYHMRLIERTAPDVLSDPVRHLDGLGEMLGDHHNLAVLADWIISTRAPTDPSSDAVLAAIAKRQAVLLDRAFALGRQLAVERPAAAAKRLEACWRLLE